MPARMIVGALMLSTLAVAGCSSENATGTGSTGAGSTGTGSTGTGSTGTGSTGTGGAGGGSDTGGAGGGGGGSGGGGACVLPTATIPLGLLSGAMCNSKYPDTSKAATIDGTFEPVPGGFHVVGAGETVEILEIEPAIPTGTLVHLTYSCQATMYGGSGAYILLENLATLSGKPNPTESGARLWFFAASGGGYVLPKPMPFELTTKNVCMVGTIQEGFQAPQEITLTGGGASVTVAPEAEAAFAPSTGPHAGSYLVKNVNAKVIGHAGGDAAIELNFSIARAH